MAHWYAFNGDADGLCALQQLRLGAPHSRRDPLVTGVKRDIELLQRVPATAGDSVTVLDISLDANRARLDAMLARNVSITWYDHHQAGEIPSDPRLSAHIDFASDVCTSALVDRHLGGAHRRWAATAAFGDSMPGLGRNLSTSAGLSDGDTDAIERLGVALNYNAYGECIADLHFDPALLAAEMLPFADPLEFIADSPSFAKLWSGYQADMAQARSLKPYRSKPGALVTLLPDTAWARRAIGVLANDLMHAHAECAIAILSPRSAGGYTASVRVPALATIGASDFCRQFPTGGGRRGAAGVNVLPAEEIDAFVARFEASFAR